MTVRFTHPEDGRLSVAPADVEHASIRLSGRLRRTPVLTSRQLDEAAGRRVFLKAEHLQSTGSYKARGATNQVVAMLEPRPRPRGVVAASSGNHGQAVAWAARRAGLPATIVVPRSIAPAKLAAIVGYGARVVTVGDGAEERIAVARELAGSQGLRDIPPYDHPLTIAGQGTWLREALADVPVRPETVLVPASGGGLAAGTLLAAAALGDPLPVYAVEPTGAADLHDSLLAGVRVAGSEPSTIADALRAHRPGALPFEVIRALGAGSLLVTDEHIVDAMRFLAERLKQVVEPGGATGVAAALARRVPGDGPLLVLLSGGNIGWTATAALLGGREVVAAAE
ncbi:threonine ammonia-lyase [Jiangella anatolica]|uniref:threonine ammonia-lyase n=1 Tax=Jiangella anatolica TaxID=2670374 RepID=A0A2W2CNF6_9ACTN|nr:threonine/serine dehydratase [Jiangella anatolica]PZF86726.1 pyridoxal-5'-phosphate-dependent protein [Jiangella anatolica]